jgi:hypothetical protein
MKILLAIIFPLMTALPAAAYDGAALGSLRAVAGLNVRHADIPVPAVPAPAAWRPARAAADLYSASSRFLGVPYVLGALGEGVDGEFDRGPLVSFTGLDCTTFVEQTMAFALGGGSDDLTLDILRRIRYQGGVIAYESRNHFTELDWLPNNMAAGFLRDITAEVAGAKTRSVAKVVSKRAWYAAKTEADLYGFNWESPAARAERAARLRALGASMPDAQAVINYVPLADLPRLLARIPHGTVVSLVRENRADRPTVVSHQFFIFDGPNGKIIRHAAQGKMVLDVDAAAYIEGLNGQTWRVLGLNLAAVNAR